jgi:hypothetical protein
MPIGRMDPLPPKSPGIVRRTETLFLLLELPPSPGFWKLCRARHRSSSGRKCTLSVRLQGRLHCRYHPSFTIRTDSWPNRLRARGCLNEASPEAVRSVTHPSVIRPSSVRSLTLQLSARVGVVGGWRGGFFFQVVFGVESGQSMSTWKWTVAFPCKFYLGAGGRIYFPFSQWEGPRCLAFIPFKFGGREGFFFPFFPVSQCVLTVFPLSS